MSGKPKFSETALERALRLLVRPLARFAIRHGLKVQQLTEALKQELTDAAEHELNKKQEKVNASRLSVITGIHRRDIRRIEETTDERVHQNLAARVLSLWQTHSDYTTKAGKPRVLRYRGEGNEFQELVRLVGTDLNSATVLFELCRVNAVEKKGDTLKVVQRNYIERGDLENGFRYLSEDMEDLVETVEHNLTGEEKHPLHHLRTEYDRIRLDALPEIHRWILQESHRFHSKVRTFLARHDEEATPKSGYSGEYTKVSFVSFENIKSVVKEELLVTSDDDE